MRNLFLFIRRFYPFFLFLLLEIVAIALISGSNAYQGATLVNSSNRITGGFYEFKNGINDYFGLRKTNEMLINENVILKKRIQNFRVLSDSGSVDTTGRDIYEFIPATVINHSVHKKLNYFTLDKGGDDGIESGMGVIDASGIVGMVTNVSQYYAVGISMLNSKTRVSVRHKKSGTIGIMRWQGNDPLMHLIEDITKTAGVSKGDTILSSGYSTYFPGGLRVAVVTDASLKEGSNFYDIRVRLTNEIMSLDKVYVVKHNYRSEMDSLEISAQ